MSGQPQPEQKEADGTAESRAPIGTGDLHALLEKARNSEHEARKSLAFLTEIFNLLPFGVLAQARDGRILFVNEAAAIQLPAAAEILAQALSRIMVAAERSAQAHSDWHALVGKATPIAIEERFVSSAGLRTSLTIHKPVRVRAEDLILSTSLDITDRKEIEEKLLRRANFDELTGLPNRFQLQEHVQSIIARSIGRFALAFIDIDNFKQINDYYSHAIGDALLVKMTNRIADNIRASDILARISGDEFLLVIGPIDEYDELVTIINSIGENLKAPFFIEGFEIFSSASIGVSIYPEHGCDYETLRRNADSAMYHVKHSTKGAATFFDASFDRSEMARMRSEQRLRWAIQDRRFRCAFQPKVDIQTGEVVGVEALIRLIDEDGEIYGPNSFIDLAFELGLGDDITHLAVCEVLNSIDFINDAFGPRATISINVAAKQASNVDFMRAFVETLKWTNFTDRFIAEVTEDAFVATSPFQSQVLPMLREAGVRVSIDDFGTGYSALSLLANVTVDEIKIDRSFITKIHQQARNQTIVKAIESLGDALGMTVVAEGIETFEELAYLRTTTRIRYAQGSYFARPLFFEDFTSAKHIAGYAQKTAEARDLRNKHLRGRLTR
jgi:c-di-GMP phosphodiesterase Gmr